MNSLDDLNQFRTLVKRLPVQRIELGRAEHPRLSLFAAARDEAEAASLVETVQGLVPGSPLANAVGETDADLRVYELDLEHPATALPEETVARTAAYGMTAIEPGPDLFCLAALSEATRVLFMISTGLNGSDDPLDLLVHHGGRDTICLFGALVAARMASLPVILDGAQALAAACVVHALAPHAVSHCCVPQGSRHEGVAVKLGLATIPYSGGVFPLSLAHAVQALRARRHGLA